MHKGGENLVDPTSTTLRANQKHTCMWSSQHDVELWEPEHKKKKKTRWQRWLFTSFFWTHFGPTKTEYPPEVVSLPGRHRFLLERRTAKTHDCWAKRGRETKKSTLRLIKLTQINNNVKQMVRCISKIRLRFTKVSFPMGRPNMRSCAELCKISINRAGCKHFQILRSFSSHYLQGC